MYLSDMFVESPENFDYLTGLGVYDFGFDNADSSIPVQDVTDQYVTNENLPEGDFLINPDEGIYVGSSVFTAQVPVRDVTDKYVTNEDLPKGDFRINPAEGIDVPVDTLDYGKIISGLSSIFDDISTDPFSSALTEAITYGMNDPAMEYSTDESPFRF